MHRAIRRFVRKIWRTWDYAKIGWKNEDWDFTYFYALLAFKLGRMQDYMEDDMVDSPSRNKSVRVAKKLAQRLASDYYRYAHDAHDRKWGDLDIKFVPAAKHPGYSEMVMHRSKAVTKQEKKKERIEFMAAVYQDDAIRERDLQLLTKIIAKHSQHWWS
jgi:hypothetical protein